MEKMLLRARPNTLAKLVRKLFRGGRAGWAHWFDDPNDLYRRRNRATNTGFTLGTTGAVPTDWIERGLITGRKTVDATTSSGFCMRVTGGGGTVGGSDDVRLTTVTGLTVGATHTVRFKAKNAGGTQPVRIAMALTGADVAITSSWATYTFNAVATSTINGIFFGAGGAGAIYDVTDIEVLSQSDLAFPYQPVSTWEQAYLDAVGAERIFAWQDSAGTTPVTSVGQSVGLVLDRAYGGMRGAEISSLSTQTVTANIYGTGVSVTLGAFYEVTFVVTKDSGTGTIDVGAANNAFGWHSSGYLSVTGAGYATRRFCFKTTDTVIRPAAIFSGGATGSVALLSVREIPGTHRIQASAPSRPLLMARVNQVANSNNFGSAAINNGVGTPAQDATGNDGVLSAWTITSSGTGDNRSQRNLTVSNDAQAWVSSVSIKKTSGTPSVYPALFAQLVGGSSVTCLAVLNTTTGTIASTGGTGYSTRVVDDGLFWRVFCTVLNNASGNTTLAACSYPVWNLDGTVNKNVQAGSAVFTNIDIRTADDAAKSIPAYQRVGATAADHDTAGFPRYLAYDGTDDSYASAATVDGSVSDKVTVVTGVTKNSDAATGTLVNFVGHPASPTDGAFLIEAPPNSGLARFGAQTRGTSARVFVGSSPYIHPAPLSSILTVACNHAAPVKEGQIYARVNSAEMPAAYDVPGPTGAGNYGTGLLSFGVNLVGGNRFNGREYASIGRFGSMSETERNRLESWVKNLMRMP